MTENMNQRHREVCQWLDAIFGTDAVPSYEINPTTIDCLWKMMKKNEKQDNAINLVIDDLRQKANEYSNEATRIGRMLSGVGLSFNSLSNSGTASLSTLVDMALILRTKDACDTSLMLAISDLYLLISRQAATRKLEEKMSSELQAKKTAILLKNTTLKQRLKLLEDEAAEHDVKMKKGTKQMALLQATGKEERKSIRHLEEKLRSSGVNSELYHSTLIRRSEELKASRETLHSLRAKLDSYQSLPPDLALAKVKVEEARRELAAIEEKITEQFDVMLT